MIDWLFNLIAIIIVVFGIFLIAYIIGMRSEYKEDQDRVQRNILINLRNLNKKVRALCERFRRK